MAIVKDFERTDKYIVLSRDEIRRNGGWL
jgi:hypothetical protein